MFAESNGKFLIRPVVGDSVKIAVAGDVCPRYSGEDYLLEGNAGKLLAGIQPALDDADLRIVQWETVISDKADPIVKCGPNLLVKPGCESFLTTGKFDIALMANNHTGDHAESSQGAGYARIQSKPFGNHQIFHSIDAGSQIIRKSQRHRRAVQPSGNGNGLSTGRFFQEPQSHKTAKG